MKIYVYTIFISLILFMTGCSNTNIYNIKELNEEKINFLINKIPTLNYALSEKGISKEDIGKGREEHNSMYTTKGKKVYYYEYEIKGADIETFVPLLGGYAVDKKNVYIGQKKMDISTNNFSFISGTTNYLTDGENIYWGDEKIQGVDKESFVGIGFENPINNIGYAKDKNNFYLRGKVLTGTELQTYLEYIE